MDIFHTEGEDGWEVNPIAKLFWVFFPGEVSVRLVCWGQCSKGQLGLRETFEMLEMRRKILFCLYILQTRQKSYKMKPSCILVFYTLIIVLL